MTYLLVPNQLTYGTYGDAHSNNQWVIKEIKTYLKTHENESTGIHSLWNAAKAVLRGMFAAIQAYIRKQEKSQIKILRLKDEKKKNKQNPKFLFGFFEPQTFKIRRKEIIMSE